MSYKSRPEQYSEQLDYDWAKTEVEWLVQRARWAFQDRIQR